MPARFWKIALIVYLALFVYGFLILHAVEDRNRIMNELWDLGHVAGFFSLMFFVYKTSRVFSGLSWRLQLLVAVTAASVLGLIIEVIQFYTGRSFSIHDVYLNIVGTLTGVAIFSNWNKFLSKKIVWLLRVLVLLLWLTVSRDAIVYSLDAMHARQQFPSLISLEYPFELSRFNGAKVHVEVVQFEQHDVIEAEFMPAKYSTLTLDHFPRDWTGYKTLKLDLYNGQDEEAEIHLRIHDIAHFPGTLYTDRFNASYPLQPGWNTVQISLEAVRQAPRGREMDMTKIHQLMLYFFRQTEQRKILIRRIGLEK